MSYIQPVCLSIYVHRYVWNIIRLKCKKISEWFCVCVCTYLFLRVSVFLRTHITLLHLFVLSPFSHTFSFTESQCFTGNSSGSGSILGSSGVPMLLTSMHPPADFPDDSSVRIVPHQPISSSHNQTQATGSQLYLKEFRLIHPSNTLVWLLGNLLWKRSYSNRLLK